MNRIVLAAALAAVALPAAPALANPPPWPPAHGRRAHEQAAYDKYGRYAEPHRLSRNDRIWRGRDGRYYCRRDNGTTGLVVGAALGGLLGNRIAGGGDRTLGTLIGAVGGGLLGRAVDQGNVRCR